MKNAVYIILIFGISISQFNYKKINTSGTMGSSTINGEIYNQVSIRPEIPIGRLGIGLDIYLYFNDQGIYKGNWDFQDGETSYKTIIDKIYYIRWGQPGEPLYFRVGALNQISLGNGILVKNYSNTMQYPEVRRIGLDYRMQIGNRVNLDIVHSDFKNLVPGVLGLRLGYDMSSRIEYGLSIVGDGNQYAGLSDRDKDNVPDALDDFPDDKSWRLDTDGDGLADHDVLEFDVDGDGLDNFYWDAVANEYVDYTDEELQLLQNIYGDRIDKDLSPTNIKSVFSLEDNKAPIYGYALDFSFKLNRKISLYGQYAVLDNNGWGFSFPAIYGKMGPLKLRAEYRQCSDQFMYSYWDRSYDLTRANVSGDEIITKSDKLLSLSAMQGYYVDMSSDLFGYIWMIASYQDLYSESSRNKSFQFDMNINTEKIPKLEVAKVFYQRSNDENIFDFKNPSPSTVYGYDVGFKVSKGMTMVYKNRMTYKTDASGEIVSVPIMQIETQMKF